MNRFKWPVKFSSILKWVKEKLKLLGSTKFIKRMKKLPKVAVFAVFLITLLIVANSFFWWYRATHGGFEFSKDATEQPIHEWEIDMDEQVLDEEEIRKQYSLNLPEGNNTIEEDESDELSEESLQQLDIDTEDTYEASNEESQQVVAAPVMATMAMPAMGKVTTEFAMETLVYSKTLEQWNSHNGIDISADIGTSVKAAMDGTVADVISNDPKLGVVVIIDHGGDIKTLYGNLKSDKLIKKGDQVKKGQVIGAVGRTAPYEIEDPPHLHFEVLKDGKNIDPQQYLPKIS